MDWVSIAQLLAEQSERPLVVLDERGHMRALNAAMAQLLARPRDAASSARWPHLGSGRDSFAAWRAQVARKSPQRTRCAVARDDGGALRLEVDAWTIGPADARATVIAVERWTSIAARPSPSDESDLEYEVVTRGRDFGRLVHLRSDGRALATSRTTARCFETLHGRSLPCADCPLLRDGREPWPRVAVRHRVGDESGFEAVRATRPSANRARVSVRFLSDTLLRAVHVTRIRRLAEEAQLSAREKTVFDYLLLGRSLSDIAMLLALSRHTVKFHQANILRKLGADSRVDITRITTL